MFEAWAGRISSDRCPSDQARASAPVSGVVYQRTAAVTLQETTGMIEAG